MSDFTPKNDILNLSPSPSKTNSSNTFNKANKTKENDKETKQKEEHENSGENTETFLNSLMKSIDETNEFLPDHMKISQKEVLNETINKLQKGSFDENDKISIFESASFMQILSMLDKLKANPSDIKLANLSTQLSSLVKTEANLNTLKGAKNLNELLDIAKNLGLNVKNIKVDRLLDLKATFPNLDKANFFKGAVDNVFKEVIHNKIAHINKNLNSLQQNTHQIKHANTKNNENSSLLSKTLQNLDSILHDKKSKNPKNEPIESNEAKTSFTKDLSKNLKQEENLMDLKDKHHENKIETKQDTQHHMDPKKTKEENLLKVSNFLKEPKEESPNTLYKEEKNIKTSNLEQDKKNTSKNTQILDQNIDKNTLNKNTPTIDQNTKEVFKENLKEHMEQTREVVKEIPKENLKEEKNNKPHSNQNNNQNMKDLLDENLKNPNPNKDNTLVKNTPLTQNLQNFKDVLNQNTQVHLNPTTKDNVLKEHKDNKNLMENKIDANLDQKLNTELSKNQSVNTKNNNAFNDLFNKENNNTKELHTNNHSQKENGLEDLNSLLKDLGRINQNQSKNLTTAKETLQYFSQDLKEAVANYKAPITKLSITLNPSNLGEVEVTLVQRGSNLHINFNSNTNAINLFMQHQAEFKNSLVNMGFTGLEMNFSDQGRREQNQNQSKNRSGYGFKDILEGKNESEKVNLELVLAKYF